MGNDLFEVEQNVFCLNKKRKGKEGMKLHKPADLTGRMLSVLLAGAVSFCGLAVPQRRQIRKMTVHISSARSRSKTFTIFQNSIRQIPGQSAFRI